MKYLILAALAVSTVTSHTSLILKQQQMDEIEFIDGVFYNLYNGFVRGLYREHVREVISDQCFGTWIQANLTHLDQVMEKIFNFEFPIPYAEAS